MVYVWWYEIQQPIYCLFLMSVNLIFLLPCHNMNEWMNEWMMPLYSTLLCIAVHPKRFTIFFLCFFALSIERTCPDLHFNFFELLYLHLKAFHSRFWCCNKSNYMGMLCNELNWTEINTLATQKHVTLTVKPCLCDSFPVNMTVSAH